MKMTKAGLDLLKEREGLRLEAYYCQAGVLTIGYGHTSAAGEPLVRPGMKISKEEAERILIDDLRKYENAVKRLVKVNITPNQYSALVSLCYNIGEGAFSKSTVLKRVNAGDYHGAAKAFAMWNKAGGKVSNGLVKRRAMEASLFLSDMDEKVSPSVKVGSSQKSMAFSTTNISAGLSAVAGATGASVQIVQNVQSLGDALPWIMLIAVIAGATFWIIRERYKKAEVGA
jgi:lysozyme